MAWRLSCVKSVWEPSLFVISSTILISLHILPGGNKGLVTTDSGVVVGTTMQLADPVSLVKDVFPSCWSKATGSVQLSAVFGIALAGDSPVSKVSYTPSQVSQDPMTDACWDMKAWLAPSPFFEELSHLQSSLQGQLRPSLRLNHSPTSPSAQSSFLLLFTFHRW